MSVWSARRTLFARHRRARRCGTLTAWSLSIAVGCSTGDAVVGDTSEGASADESGEAQSASEGEAGTSESTGGGGYCGGVEFFSRPIPLRMVFVADNSAATLTPYDDDGDPGTPDRSPRERMDEFAGWFFDRYPGDDGCHPLAPGLVWSPRPGAAAPPDADACSVDAAQVEPDVDSQAPFDAAWASRPPASGAAALADAYARAVNSFGGVPSWEQPVIVVLAASPPACGGGDSEVIDNRLFQRMNDAWEQQGIQTVVLRAGSSTGGSSTEVDGVPDGVDLALYWGSLQSVVGSWHYDVEERSEIEALFDIASPSYGDCTYRLDAEERTPPSSADLVDIVAVDGTPYDRLDISTEDCMALSDGGGWIWESAPVAIRLCGTACEATQCEAQSPWPDNAVEVEVPYLCE